MSAQPYSDVEIRAIQCAHDEGIPESVNLAWVRTAEPRWLATVDALTSRLDAATRENARLVKCVKDEWDGEAADKILTNVEELTAALDAATRRADEVGAILNEPIVWERDLEDDCIASWRGLFAHAEQMDRQVADDPESCDSWFCSVTRPDPACKSHNGSGNPCTCTDIIHSAENCAHPRSGFEAREMCERYMRVEAARAALARIDAALSTGSTPATTANPGDKADRIDAAKEGRHA